MAKYPYETILFLLFVLCLSILNLYILYALYALLNTFAYDLTGTLIH